VIFAKAETRREQRGHDAVRWIAASNLRAFVMCTTCHQPFMVVLEPKKLLQGQALTSDASAHERYLNRISTVDALFEGASQKHRTHAIAPDRGGEQILGLYRVAEVFPRNTLQRPDRDLLPAQINAAFDELQHVLAAPRHAVIACRRILEQATDERLEKPKKTLADRIDQLRDEGLITRDVAQWSHDLRRFLNEAVHEERPPTAEEAREVQDFTRLLIDLLYVYPARIKRLSAAHPHTP